MKQTIHFSDFADAFKDLRPSNFSNEGLEVLFNYLEEIDKDMELDVIAICCDFSQCSLREFTDAFGIACEDNDLIDAVQEHIDQKGFWYALIHDDKEVIFQNF
jgi:hypothetical protein